MRFVLTVDLDQLTTRTDNELARILRYWADALTSEDLDATKGMNIYDSSYTKVGKWRVEATADDAQDAA